MRQREFTLEQLKAAGAVAGLKYKVRTARFENYKASATFDPVRVHGRSYGWWAAVVQCGPFVVFNACSYSNQTAKHLGKMRRVMRELGIKIDFEVYAPKGLDEVAYVCSSGGWREQMALNAVDHLTYQIKKLREEMSRPKSRKATNDERARAIAELMLDAEILKGLQSLRNVKGSRRTVVVRRLRALKVKQDRLVTKHEKLREAQRDVLCAKRDARREAKAAAEMRIRAASHESQSAHLAEVIQFRGGVR